MPDILILTTPIFECGEKELIKTKSIAQNYSVKVVDQKEVDSETIKSAEIIFGWPNKEQLAVAKNLKWLHLPSAGADAYTDRNSYCNRDIVLTKLCR